MIEQLALRMLRIGALGAAAGLGACTTVLLPPNITPVVAPSRSVDEAARRLAQVATERAAAEAEFAESERICYTKFFVNSCLDDAKEKRRSALAYLRAVEVEAEYFTRKAAVEQRDREVEQAIREFEAGEARAAAAPPAEPAEPAEAQPGSERRPVAPKATLAERRAAQDAKLARRAAQQQADAPKRAASKEEFEQRRQQSLARQRKVEQKKAEQAAKPAGPAQ